MADWYYRNLVSGQWQIGNLLMGRGTNMKVKTAEVAPYDIEAQDFKRPKSDERNFGKDFFSPTTIQFELMILNNRLLPGFEATNPNFWHSMPTLEDFAWEWRGDEVRNQYGGMKPLYHRSRLDGIEKIIFGRPGQFSPSYDDEFNRGEVVNVLAEFRRADTYAYGLNEKSIVLSNAQKTGTISGHAGKGPTWMRILILGPVNHPIITLTNMYQLDTPLVVDFDYNIPAGMVVEISGYPWSRRVVNSAGLALPRKLIGQSPYLDKLRFNFNSSVGATLAGSSMTSATRATILYRDSYTVI